MDDSPATQVLIISSIAALPRGLVAQKHRRSNSFQQVSVILPNSLDDRVERQKILAQRSSVTDVQVTELQEASCSANQDAVRFILV